MPKITVGSSVGWKARPATPGFLWGLNLMAQCATAHPGIGQGELAIADSQI